MKIDFHMHTKYSGDSNASPDEVVARAAAVGLDAIAITDHNEVKGASEVAQIAEKVAPSLTVIIGEEVTTDMGDVLALFIKKRIPPAPLRAVIFEIKKQGGLLALPHPFDSLRGSRPKVEKMDDGIIKQVAAVEGLNARVALPWENARAVSFAQEHNLPLIACSDAHFPEEIGAAWTEVACANASEGAIKAALLAGKTEMRGHLAPPWVHLKTTAAKIFKKAGVWK